MSLFRQVARGVWILFHRKRANQEVAEEFRHYLEQTARELESAGFSPREAHRQARIQLGTESKLIDEIRDSGWENWLGTVLSDLRHAFRRLRLDPGFTAATVLTLALGIGATTAIFSAIKPVLFDSLPYPDAKRLVMISDSGGNGESLEVTFHTYLELKERSHSFARVAVIKPWKPTQTGGNQPERLEGQKVSADYFTAFGVAPALGSDFDPSDDRLGGAKAVVVSDRFWRQRLAGDPARVGRQIRLDDDLYTVVGVLPPSYQNALGASAELWSLLQYDTRKISSFQTREWGHHLKMIGRLLPQVNPEQAKLQLDAIAMAPIAEFPRPPWASLQRGLIVRPLQEEITQSARPALIAVLGAVALLLLISCVNVTNLLLARGARMRGEFALRVALGAGRMRVMQQLLAESLLLAAFAGAAGMGAAQAAMSGLVAMSPPGIPRLTEIRIDGELFAFALLVTGLVGLAVGLLPALQATKAGLNLRIQESSARMAGGRNLARRILVVAEVAFALVLLVSAGLLLHSLDRLFSISPGFEPSGLLTLQLQGNGHRLDPDAAKARYFFQVLETVRRLPGVKMAALTSQLPLSGDLDLFGVQFEDDSNPNGDFAGYRYAVSTDYCQTMGIPLRRGRFLNAQDTSGAPAAVLISESLAKRKFASADPLGKRLRVGPDIGKPDRPWGTIVGVVGNVRQVSLATPDTDAIYVSTSQWAWVDSVQSIAVQTQGDPADFANPVRQAIWSVDKDQPILRVATMESLVSGTAAERHFALTLFEAFGLVALLLAATGIYGVISGSVTERLREIGVRAALGASRRTILTLVLRQGMTLAAVGIALGLGGAALASQALTTLLFDVSRLDPPTYMGVAALLAAVSALASGIPAWRAAQTDPAITLRSD